jgi:hypothetical protein
MVVSATWTFAGGIYMLHFDAFDDGVCETVVFIYTFTVPSTVLKTRLSIELMAKISL